MIIFLPPGGGVSFSERYLRWLFWSIVIVGGGGLLVIALFLTPLLFGCAYYPTPSHWSCP